MSSIKTLSLTLAFAFTFIVVSPLAKADQWNKKTVLTFDQPVQIPGHVLQPGTYVFKLVDSEADRHIVQVMNKDEDKVVAVVLALPDFRIQPTGKTVVNFQERAVNSPEAIQAWFYPGDNFGQAFVYPKVEAARIAQAAQQPVYATPAPQPQPPAEMKKEEVIVVKPHEEVAQAAPPPAAPPAEPAPAPQPPAPQPPAPVKQLPRTASNVPLFGLIGIGALLLSGTMRLAARRA